MSKPASPQPAPRVQSKDGRLTGSIVGSDTGRIVRVAWDTIPGETSPAFRENLIFTGEVA